MSISYPRLPGAITAANQQQQGPVKSLLDIAIDACVHNRQYLGDVGFVEAPHLRRILPHCNRAQLEAIEDDTLAHSGRDLSWFTWDCWYVMFTQLYGPPGPDDALLQLPDDPPSDYSPPRGLAVPPADYRSMVYTREAAIAARKAAAVNKLRAGYGKEAAARQALQVKYTVKLPPPKRARRGAVMMEQQAAAAPGRTIAGKPASKVLNHLGLAGGGGSRNSRPAHASHHHHHQQQQRRPVYSGYTSSSSSQQQQRPAGIGSAAAAGGAGGQNSRGQLGVGGSSRQGQAAAAARNIGAQQQQQQQRQGTLVGQKRQAAAGQLLDRPIALNASRGAAAAAGTTPGSKAGAAGSKAPPPGPGPSRTVGASGGSGGTGGGGVGLLDRPLTLRR